MNFATGLVPSERSYSVTLQRARSFIQPPSGVPNAHQVELIIAHTVILVKLSADQNETDVVRSYSEGACSYIMKPARFEELSSVVKQFALYWALVARLPARP
jgi:response regulator of citrate/malate metabolism